MFRFRAALLCSKRSSPAHRTEEFDRKTASYLFRSQYHKDELHGVLLERRFPSVSFGITKANECAIADCPMLGGLSNFLKDPVYSFDNEYLSVVQFACEDGYVIQGASSITCLAGGKWSAEVPTCKSKYTQNMHILLFRDGENFQEYTVCRCRLLTKVVF